MILNNVCFPVILYIGFSLIQIIIDFYNKLFNKALLKFIIMIIFGLIINMLCNIGLQVIAWIIVLIPFLYLTLVTTLIFKIFSNKDNNYFQSNHIDLSNADLSNNITSEKDISYNELVNDNIDRINRDLIRNVFYYKTDKYFNLKFDEKNIYDLSKNPYKYNLIYKLLNESVNSKYIDLIYNKQLFNYLIPQKYIDALNVKINNNINRNYNNKLRNYYILDSNNYIPCPSNENPTSFFRKTGFNCYDLNQNTINEQNIDSNNSLKIRTIIDYK